MSNEIENEIQAKGLTAKDGIAGSVSGDMVNRFLCWPVPASVYPDGTPGQPKVAAEFDAEIPVIVGKYQVK